MDRITRFKKSFKHAFSGLAYAIRNEKNFQNEILVAILVFMAMIYFSVTRAESVVLILVISSVLLAELMNTVMERIVDILKPRVHPYIRVIKDMMAAGVLLASLMAFVVGVIIFYPYIAQIF